MAIWRPTPGIRQLGLGHQHIPFWDVLFYRPWLDQILGREVLPRAPCWSRCGQGGRASGAEAALRKVCTRLNAVEERHEGEMCYCNISCISFVLPKCMMLELGKGKGAQLMVLWPISSEN